MWESFDAKVFEYGFLAGQALVRLPVSMELPTEALSYGTVI